VLALILAFSVLPASAANVSAAPTTYYIDKTNVLCSDSGLGTSPSAPFCTITQGANIAVAGDTVRVLAGSYAETVNPNFDGAIGNPITFSAVAGVAVTGAPGNSTNGGAFRMSAKNYITIDGFTIVDTADYGIYALGSTNITITNNNISSAGDPSSVTNRDGIYFKSTTNSLISGNKIHHNSRDGIRLSGCSNVTISNNSSYANAVELSRASEGIHLIASSNNTILHNIVYANEDSGLNIYPDAVPVSSSNNQIIGNISYGNGDHGIDINNSPNNIVVGNTVQGNVTSGINLEGTTGSGGATIQNNIAVDNGFLQLAGGGTSPGEPGNIRVDANSIAGTTLNYNLYYRSGGTYQVVWGVGSSAYFPTLADFKTAVPTQEVNGLEGNPLFTSAAPVATRPAATPFNMTVNAGNYHINFGSPAIDSANADANGEPANDISGNPRVDFLVVPDTGAGVRTYDDRGPYEFQPPPCYVLTINTGVNGSTPTASPLKSAQCPVNGQYVAGEVINLSGATPNPGYQIAGWVGTDNNSSLAGTNTVTMPASARAAGVIYSTTNIAPVITEGVSVPVTMSEDGAPTVFSLTLHATDANGDTLTWSISTPAAHGTAGASGTGASMAISYLPVANYNTTDSFVVQVSDGRGGTDTITVNVTITPVNDAPVITEGVSVGVTMSEDGSPTPFSQTLNATDVDSATLTWSILGAASHGTAGATGTGLSKAITYAPTANYNGPDSFIVQVSDGSLTDTITVNVTITPVNDAPTCSGASLTVAEDTAGDAAPSCTDVDGNPLTYGIVVQPAHGTASVVGGLLHYVPSANYNGSDSFTYKANDGTVDSNVATVTVTVTPVNDAPVITEGVSVGVTMSEDGSPTPFSQTLNATDVDSATLTWSILGAASHGTAGATGTGLSKAITYAPTANYNGPDSFIVQVSDGSLTDTITVNVTITPVNDAPTCSGASLTVAEDTAGDAAPSCTDVDGNPLTYGIVVQPAHGTASVVGGLLHYVPSANYNGSDSFTYKANDGTVDSNVATVTVTVTPVNDAPVCSAIPLNTPEDTMGEISPSCTDVDGDILSHSIVGSATNGVASVVSGKLRYVPSANYNGSDSFTYKANDTHVDSNTTTVTVTVAPVNDPPVISEGLSVGVTMSEDGSPTPFSLTLNATDVDSATLTWSISGAAGHGTAGATGTGLSKAITYAPTGNYNGSDSFIVQVSDSSGGIDTITVYVTINPVNDAPTCSGIPLTTNEDTTGEVSPFCLDVDGDALSYSIVGPAANGTALVVSGKLRYVPAANYSGSDSFTYKASDGVLDSNISIVNVTVYSVNDAPVITEGLSVSVTMSEDGSPTPFSQTLNATDVDTAGASLTWSISGAASHGTAGASGTGVSKAITYTPTTNYNGSDSFVVQVSDGSLTDTITVNVTINPVNDAPTCSGASLTVAEDTAGDATPICTDVDGNPLTYGIVAQPAHGTASVVGGLLHYVPAANYSGSDSFTYKANDGLLDSNTATVTVTVTAVNDAPVITEGLSIPVNMSKNSIPVPFNLTLNATDIDSGTLTWSISTPATHGVASASGTGVSMAIGYIPLSNYEGPDSFVVHVSDGSGGIGTITVNVSITEVTYMISGNAGVAGTTVSYTDGTPTTADNDGEYSFTVPYDWSGEVTPSKTGYSFSPVSRIYTGVRGDKPHENFGAWTPAHHSLIGMNLPYFSWPETPGATGYQFQVSRSNTFSTTILSKTVSGTNYTPASYLPANLILYWRVKANGVNPSGWSEVWSFTSANPPSVPVLVSLVNNTLTTDYTPRLDWKDSVVPLGTVFDKYQIQIAKEIFTNSTVPVIDEDVTGGVAVSEFTPSSDLDANTKYYWRVKAYNDAGQYSAWSSVWYFRTAMKPPVLSAPANVPDPALEETRPVFEWGDVSGALNYTLQVSASSSMSSPIISATVMPSTYTPVKDLSQGKVLYWRVKANGVNPSGWSEVWSFTSANPPSVPVLVSPVSNSLLVDYTPRLDWKDSVVPLGTVFDKYEIQISKDMNFAGAVGQEAAISEYTPGSDLDSNAKYYWRVRVYNDDDQYSSWSSSWYFRTAMKPPVLSAPANVLDPALSTTRPKFEWTEEDASGVTNYTLQVSASSSMSSPVLSAIVSGTAYTPSSDLPKGKVLYWRVKANGVNPSGWSEVWSFTSANPPSVPVLISPVNNTLTTFHKPWLDWKDTTLPIGTNFDKYEIQFATDPNFTSLEIDDDVLGITNSSYTPAEKIASNTKHFWRVRACNTLGQCSLWSSVWYFRTALDEPELLYPDKGNTSIPIHRPSFTWGAVSLAASYTIQISSSPTITATVTAPTFTPSVDLPEGIMLYWKVMANGANPSGWSDMWSFKIAP
jgi:parallel beta-helix repeat protein/VCBS repeat-containing protein